MSQVPIYSARGIAVRRVLKVLRSQFKAVLDEVASQEGFEFQPAPDSFYATDPSDIDEVARNVGVALWLWPSNERRPVREFSSVGDRFKAQTSFELDCVIVFEEQIKELGDDEDGQPYDQQTFMRRRSEIYTGALIECVLRYAIEGDSIHDIKHTSDIADPVLLDTATLIGVSQATFEVSQFVSMPCKRPLPDT